MRGRQSAKSGSTNRKKSAKSEKIIGIMGTMEIEIAVTTVKAIEADRHLEVR
jgi:hypothetical protein